MAKVTGFNYGGLVPEHLDPIEGRDGSNTVQVEIEPTGRGVFLDGVEIPEIAGAPTDSDLTNTEGQGAVLLYDSTNHEIYVRASDGTYRSVAVV